MITLNADVMRMILPYFDGVAWAKLAQVSKTWQQLAYRPSVWINLAWKPKLTAHTLFLKKHEIPQNARHMGEPTKLCYQAWLQHTIRTQNFQQFSREFVHSTNNESKMKYLYAHWLKHKPCVHAHHHVWTDVIKGRTYLNGLKPSDLCRLYLRIMEDQDPSTNLANSYLTYMNDRIAECAMEVLPIFMAPHTLDVVGQLFLKVRQDESSLDAAVREEQMRLIQPYQLSKTAISRHGLVEFSNNERRYTARGSEMLDAAAFSL